MLDKLRELALGKVEKSR